MQKRSRGQKRLVTDLAPAFSFRSSPALNAVVRDRPIKETTATPAKASNTTNEGLVCLLKNYKRSLNFLQAQENAIDYRSAPNTLLATNRARSSSSRRCDGVRCDSTEGKKVFGASGEHPWPKFPSSGCPIVVRHVDPGVPEVERCAACRRCTDVRTNMYGVLRSEWRVAASHRRAGRERERERER